MALERTLKVRFHDPDLLLRALTHRSYAHEHPDLGLADNERLEFLGDAVLELLSAEMLFRRDVEASEGELTLARAAMVSTGALAAQARAIELGPHLRVGRGVAQSGGRDLDSLLANTLEALLAAIYLDQGIEVAAKVFKRLHPIPVKGTPNYKGLLQERTQANGGAVPRYDVVETSGPGHLRRWFVEVHVEQKRLGKGEGASRRAAEQAAAAAAIEMLVAAEKDTQHVVVRRPKRAQHPVSAS